MPQPDGGIDVGALGAPVGGNPPAPQNTVAELEIGGTKYVVAPALAEALRAEEQRRTSEMQDLRVTVDRLQKTVTAPPAAPATPKTASNVADRLFTDPDAVLDEHGKAIEERVTRKLTADYQAEQARTKFWKVFFKEHDDLTDDQEVVEYVMGRDYEELAALPIAKQNEVLADKTRKFLRKHVQPKVNENRVQVEGGGTPGQFVNGAPPPPEPTGRDDNVTSISTILRNRSKSRYEARTANRKA